MPELAQPSWRSLPRGPAPYAERADAGETRLDRWLLAAGARLAQPLAARLRRRSRICGLVAAEQAAADRLGGESLREAAERLRADLLGRGFADDLVARAFALVRTAADRTLGLRHHDVQLLGGHALLRGMLAEMDTGEGKTLTATLAASTAALAGLPVHVITVNDYLARRDAEAMGPLYDALGLTTAFTAPGQSPDERRAAYAADICYCTNKDVGFDYLRDRLALGGRRSRGRVLVDGLLDRGGDAPKLLLRGLYFAIVDEADSVLIDEARTPLVISGGGDAQAERALHEAGLGIARNLERVVHFEVDAAEHLVTLTDAGRERVKALSGELPDAWRSERAREELVRQALNALHLFERDRHYLVRDGKVQIIDEFTGRVMADRSWERGLQQLVEVKEGCEVTPRRATLARITYQRLFRRYLHLCGMTGTASEAGPELEAVYGLKVARIPTHRPSRRRDLGASLHVDRAAKWRAVAARVDAMTRQGRPVLVGTRSVADAEALSAVLTGEGIDHVVLNARQDAAEAGIVAHAGEPGRVTVATNMAGRGTDIRLAPGVPERGGLHVILTEYHESRRIDRQLFGRCGRQGDRGSFEAIVSLEDDIFRRHAAGLARLVAAGIRSRPFARLGAKLLRAVAQQAAERRNAQDRRATMETDRKLEAALAFAGQAE